MNDPAIEDLNALIPKKRIIKIGDPVKEIELEQPKLRSVLVLGELGARMSKINELKDDEVEKLENDLDAAIKAAVPGLKDITLNTSQRLKIMDILMEMTAPEDYQELKRRGIEVGADTKKAQ